MFDFVQRALGYCHSYRATTEIGTVVLVVTMFIPLLLIRILCGGRTRWVGWFAASLIPYTGLYLFLLAIDSVITDGSAKKIATALQPIPAGVYSALANGSILEASCHLRPRPAPLKYRIIAWAVLFAPMFLAPCPWRAPLPHRLADAVVSSPCVLLLVHGLAQNLGLSRSAREGESNVLTRGVRGSVLVNVGRFIAYASAFGYMAVGTLYAIHPLFTRGAHTPVPGKGLVETGIATESLCLALAFFTKAGLLFVGLFVAIRHAVGIGTSSDIERFWSSPERDDPIGGMVRVADAHVHPASTALVWSAPSGEQQQILFHASRAGDAVRIERGEIQEYLSNIGCADRIDLAESITSILNIARPGKSALHDIPVQFGEGTIGRLIIKSRPGSLGIVARQRLEKFVQLTLAPALQARREQALLDAITERFGEAPPGGTREVAKSIAWSLFGLFKPIEARVLVTAGATQIDMRASSEHLRARGAADEITCPLKIEDNLTIGAVRMRCALPLSARDAAFFLFYREPILGAVGRLVSARLVEAVRRELDGYLDDLQGTLAECRTVDDLLAALPGRLTSIGVVGAELLKGQETTPTPTPSIVPAPRLKDSHPTLLGGALMIHLLETRDTLRMPISLASLTPEILAEGTPWRHFVDRLQHILSATYIRIIAADDLQNLQLKYARLEGIATVAVSTGLIVHQLANLTTSISASARILFEQMCLGQVHTDDPDLRILIERHSGSAKELHALVGDLRTYSAFTSERPCALDKVLERNERMFRASMLGRGIELSVLCSPEDRAALIDVPFHIAALALANLIENSKAAISGRGRIEVIIARAEGVITAHVVDTGCGVPEHLQARLFDLGVSTKPGSGGWGLHLTRKSLSEFGATVTLASTSPHGSTFTLTLPEKST